MMRAVPASVRHAALALLGCLAFAAASAPASAASVEDARKFVDSVGKQALDIIGTKLGKEQKEKKLEKLFGGTVDIPWVGRFTLGRYWREASEAQRTRYLSEYENFWVKHYASRFAEYSGGSYRITGASQDDDGEYTVNMVMTTAEDHQDVAVDYRVHADNGGKLKLFDIVVEGVSMIATQRSEFSSVVGSKGLDYLIDQLAHRTLVAGSK